jgi:hypothetical protein
MTTSLRVVLRPQRAGSADEVPPAGGRRLRPQKPPPRSSGREIWIAQFLDRDGAPIEDDGLEGNGSCSLAIRTPARPSAGSISVPSARRTRMLPTSLPVRTPTSSHIPHTSKWQSCDRDDDLCAAPGSTVVMPCGTQPDELPADGASVTMPLTVTSRPWRSRLGYATPTIHPWPNPRMAPKI